MYFNVLNNGSVIVVLDQLIFLKYDKHLMMMVNSDIDSANAVLSSDRSDYWHVSDYPSPGIEIETVDLVEITKQEYERLKVLNLKTPEEIIDAYTLTLFEGGIL